MAGVCVVGVCGWFVYVCGCVSVGRERLRRYVEVVLGTRTRATQSLYGIFAKGSGSSDIVAVRFFMERIVVGVQHCHEY